jgi:hypothetical protein
MTVAFNFISERTLRELGLEILLLPCPWEKISSFAAEPHVVSCADHHFSITLLPKLMRLSELEQKTSTNMPNKVVHDGKGNNTVQQ